MQNDRKLKRAASVALLAFIVCAFAVTEMALADPAHPDVWVTIDGALPGFDTDQAPKFLADQMIKDETRSWSFRPAADTFDTLPLDRVVWHFTSQPYAGGGVRQFVPIPSLKRLFGARETLAVKAEFYLHGQLRAQARAQAVVTGGSDDKDLQTLIATVTKDLESGVEKSTGMPVAKP